MPDFVVVLFLLSKKELLLNPKLQLIINNKLHLLRQIIKRTNQPVCNSFYKRMQNYCSFLIAIKNQKTIPFFVKKGNKKTTPFRICYFTCKNFSRFLESPSLLGQSPKQSTLNPLTFLNNKGFLRRSAERTPRMLF